MVAYFYFFNFRTNFFHYTGKLMTKRHPYTRVGYQSVV